MMMMMMMVMMMMTMKPHWRLMEDTGGLGHEDLVYDSDDGDDGDGNDNDDGDDGDDDEASLATHGSTQGSWP